MRASVWRRRFTAAGALTLLGGACSTPVDGLLDPSPMTPSSPEVPTIHRSGQRLRARLLDADGGAAQFLGWHDTLFDVDCRYTYAADGALRCLPVAGTGLYFEDDQCTQPLVTEAPCAPAGLVTTTESPPSDADTCITQISSRTSVYRMGPVVNPARLFRRDQGRCLELGSPMPLVLRRPEPVAPEEFVAAERVLQPRDDRISAWVMIGADGSEEANGLYDRRREADCFLPYGGYGDDRCLDPTKTAYPTSLLDQACEASLAYGNTPCGRPEVIFEPGEPRDCGRYEVTYFEVGPEVNTAGRGSPASCEVAAAPAGNLYYQRGSEDRSDRWPRLTRRRVGSGPVQIERLYSATDQPLPTLYTPFTFADGRECFLVSSPAEPDAERCLDRRTVTVVSPSYSDPECTVGLAVLYLSNVGGCSRTPTPTIAVELPPSDDCAPTRYAVHELGPIFVGASLYQRQGGACVSAPIPHGAPDGRVEVYQLGVAVDLSTAPSLRYRTE